MSAEQIEIGDCFTRVSSAFKDDTWCILKIAPTSESHVFAYIERSDNHGHEVDTSLLFSDEKTWRKATPEEARRTIKAITARNRERIGSLQLQQGRLYRALIKLKKQAD